MQAPDAHTAGRAAQPQPVSRADDPASPARETNRLARDEYLRPRYDSEAAAEPARHEEPHLTPASAGDREASQLTPGKTERTVASTLAGRFERIRAQDVMTSAVTNVRPATSVERAAHLMEVCDCGMLPVIGEDGLLVGVVTDRDIALRVVARGRDPRRAIVADCMTERVYACYPYDSLGECTRQMSRHRVRRLPIVNERGKLLGIVAQSDLARYVRRHAATDEERTLAELMGAIAEPGDTTRR